MSFTDTPSRFLKKGDVVLFPDADDRERCGVVTRTLGQTHLATRVRTVHVWATTADGEEFVGVESDFVLLEGGER